MGNTVLSLARSTIRSAAVHIETCVTKCDKRDKTQLVHCLVHSQVYCVQGPQSKVHGLLDLAPGGSDFLENWVEHYVTIVTKCDCCDCSALATPRRFPIVS